MTSAIWWSGETHLPWNKFSWLKAHIYHGCRKEWHEDPQWSIDQDRKNMVEDSLTTKNDHFIMISNYGRWVLFLVMALGSRA
jgi:hypothetical protein